MKEVSPMRLVSVKWGKFRLELPGELLLNLVVKLASLWKHLTQPMYLLRDSGPQGAYYSIS